jgi:hypothetical protein
MKVWLSSHLKLCGFDTIDSMKLAECIMASQAKLGFANIILQQ